MNVQIEIKRAQRLDQNLSKKMYTLILDEQVTFKESPDEILDLATCLFFEIPYTRIHKKCNLA